MEEYSIQTVIQKLKDPLTRGAGAEVIAYMTVQLNTTQLKAAEPPYSDGPIKTDCENIGKKRMIYKLGHRISILLNVPRKVWVGGNRSKERDRKSELVLRSTYQIFEWDRNNWDRNFYNVVRYVHIPLVP